jgi:hypothetical protein
MLPYIANANSYKRIANPLIDLVCSESNDRCNMLSHGDLNTDNPAMVEALEITGRKPNYELRKLVDCLESLPPTNTAVDNQALLDAARTVLSMRSGR